MTDQQIAQIRDTAIMRRRMIRRLTATPSVESAAERMKRQPHSGSRLSPEQLAENLLMQKKLAASIPSYFPKGHPLADTLAWKYEGGGEPEYFIRYALTNEESLVSQKINNVYLGEATTPEDIPVDLVEDEYQPIPDPSPEEMDALVEAAYKDDERMCADFHGTQYQNPTLFPPDHPSFYVR